MPESVPTQLRRRVRREDLLAGLLLTVFVVSVALLISIVMIAHWFEPQGSLFGRPTRIWTCGRSYRTDPGPQQIWTRSRIDAGIAPGYEPVIFEPVVGQIPLFAPLAGRRDFHGFQVCDTLVFLHVGPDAYLVFALEGGP